MHHSNYRDPLDGPPPKWVRKKPDPSETSAVDPWAHIPDINRSAKHPSQSLASSTPKHRSHTPIASVVKEKVAEIALPQPPASIPSKISKVDRPAITGNEEHIANQLLLLSDADELFSACSDQSGEQFLSLCTPLIERLCEFTQGETIKPDHVLHLLRTTLKITIPQ